MIINQTTTLIFEYPQDYLQEQEWCKTKEDRWIHKSTDTLGAVYENTISYSIGQPSSSEIPNNCEKTDCDTCRYAGECDWEPWQECPYEPKTEPTISKMEQVDKPSCDTCKLKDTTEWCKRQEVCRAYQPKDEPQTETEIAKAIVRKMIDDAVIAEDAYPDLRQKMHDAVDEYEPQTDEPPMDEYYKDHDEFYDCARYVITNDEGERAYNCIGCQTDCAWR